MPLKEGDILENFLLTVVENEPTMSPTLTEEAMLLDEPQEAQVTTKHPPGCPGEASEPESASRLKETAADPPGQAKAATTITARFWAATASTQTTSTWGHTTNGWDF